jgi:hypothetical protein
LSTKKNLQKKYTCSDIHHSLITEATRDNKVVLTARISALTLEELHTDQDKASSIHWVQETRICPTAAQLVEEEISEVRRDSTQDLGDSQAICSRGKRTCRLVQVFPVFLKDQHRNSMA